MPFVRVSADLLERAFNANSLHKTLSKLPPLIVAKAGMLSEGRVAGSNALTPAP
jgi:hypothetical protein